MDPHAIILSVGTELTSGQTVDTNSAYLACRLAELGILTEAHYVVDDHQGRIAEALNRAVAAAPVVVISGGLGPTADDLTRQALAQAMGVDLVLDEPSLRHIEAFFRLRGRQMNETNRIQAMVPRTAEALHNAAGTAPGIFARLGRAQVFVVPGVPSEMRHMAQEHILPRLAAVAGQSRTVFRTVHTFGHGESDVAVRIQDLMGRESNPLVGTTVAGGVVSVRVISRSGSRDAAVEQARRTVELIRQRLGDLVFGVDEQTLAGAAGDALRDRDRTLAVAESCTGGLLGKMLTDAAGSSDYFVGGVVCYANRIKQEWLGVPEGLLRTHGAVSEPVAEAMARGARDRFGADHALAVTGIAGPAGGTEDKPVGLVYTAHAGPGGVRVHRAVLPGDRAAVRLRSALTALNMLRLDLMRE